MTFTIPGGHFPKPIDVSIVVTGSLSGAWAVRFPCEGKAVVEDDRLLLSPHIALFFETHSLEDVLAGCATWREALGSGAMRAAGDLNVLPRVLDLLFPLNRGGDE